mgnify:CR=1 FL=1
MKIADLAVKRPVMMTVIVIVFAIFGYIGFNTLSLNLLPDVKIPFVTIQTVYPGAGPKEIETLVTKKIEDVVATIEGIETMDSYSLDGVSIIIIEFNLAKDVDVANQEVKDKVDQIANLLPSDAKKPIIQKVDFRATPVADLVLSGEANPKELYDIADKIVKNRLSQIKGVANVVLTGGQEREIQIQLDDKVIFENMISLPAMMGAIASQNMDLPGGSFEIADQEFSVRVKGQFDSVATIAETQISTPFGMKKIREIAKVVDTTKKVKQRAIYFDTDYKVKYENAIRIGVIKNPEGNVVEVVKSLKEVLPELQKSLPPGTELKIVNEQATFVESAVNDTLSNIYLGVVLTALVLFFFLHDWRSTFIAAIMMPTSIISSFMLFQAVGLDLNLLSLMGISVTIGVLVANAVVIIENIFRYKDMGYKTFDATIKGTNEVFVAVLASTMTNIVVFVPLANLSSIVGQFLRNLALAATFTTIFSLLYSFILTPMLSNLLISDKKKIKGKLASFMEEVVDNFFIKLYKKSIEFILKSKLTSSIIILATIVLFIFVLVVFGRNVAFEFQPEFDQGIITLKVELPIGYNLQATDEIVNLIETKLEPIPEINKIVSDLGKASNIDIGTNLSTITLYLDEKQNRTKTLNELVKEISEKLADVKNAKINIFKGVTGQGGGSPIEFYILGQNEYVIQKIADEVFDKLKDIPGLANFEQSTRTGKPEITIIPKRDKLAEVGVNLNELALTIRLAIEGMAQTKFKVRGEEYDITIKMKESDVDAPQKIRDLPIVTPSGIFKLSDLAEIKFTPGPTKVLHRNKFVTVKFTGNPAPGFVLGNVSADIEKRLKEINFPSGYSYAWGGQTKIFKQMMMDLGFAFFLGIILTYLLLAAILESFIQPLYIMFTVPLGLIGVIIAAVITNTALGISGLMGVILLTGIVVNNAILILDLTNQLVREEGKHIRESLIYASVVKLKPIIMANAALALSMMPLALGIGDAGVEIRTPLGIVSVGGIVASTLLTIFVIPALYFIFAKEKKHYTEEPKEA